MPGSARHPGHSHVACHFRLLSFVVQLEAGKAGELEGAGVGTAWKPSSVDLHPIHCPVTWTSASLSVFRAPEGVKCNYVSEACDPQHCAR